MNFDINEKKYTNNWFDNQITNFDLLTEYKDKPVNFLEIGSWEGRSTCWMLDNILTDKNSTITCIDSWGGGWEHSDHSMNEVENRFLSNTKEYSHKIQIIKSESKSALLSIQNKKNHYDFIYIDGGHTMLNVLEDCILSFDLLKSGGIMAFDDYLWGSGVSEHLLPKKAIECLLFALQDKITIIKINYQVWIRKK